MRDISLKELLEAGCHFGHQVTRQNPRAREFIFTAREGVHIIDLAKTREGLLAAGDFVKSIAEKGGTIVLVGTKRQARPFIDDASEKMGAFSITHRWIGGTLTNFEQVGKNYKKLKDLKAKLASPEERAKYKKKEVGMWDKDRAKLEKFYGGIYEIAAIPSAVFIIDTHKEHQAVKEANRTGVPVVGIVDTNADPSAVDYPIPANDDAVGSIKLIVDYLIESWAEGKKAAEKVGQVDEVGKVVKEEKVGQVEKVETEKKGKEEKVKEKKDGKRKPRTTKKTA